MSAPEQSNLTFIKLPRTPRGVVLIVVGLPESVGRVSAPVMVQGRRQGAVVGGPCLAGAVAKTQYYTAASIDGFIADRDNSLDWLFDAGSSAGKEDRFAGFFAGVGAMAMGARTYEWAVEHERLLEDPGKWRQWYGSVPCWVFTHRRLPAVPGADLVFARGNVRGVHEDMMRAADGRNVWLVGGGQLAGQFADRGLLDEILLEIAPVMLGEGTALLPRRLLASDLTLAAVGHDAQFVFLTYQVTPEGQSPVRRGEAEGSEGSGGVAGVVTGGSRDAGGAAGA